MATDWESLKDALATLKKDLSILAVDTPQPDEPLEEGMAVLRKQARRSRNCGYVFFTEQAVNRARATGKLRLSCMPLPGRNIGHVIVMVLFGDNASFALKDAESRAFMRRIITSLEVSLPEEMEVSWQGEITRGIDVSGNWD